MPIYDYRCPTCGPFERRRPMREAMTAVPCDACRALAPRMPAAPRLNLMSSNNRIAETRNEKSAHEPDVLNIVGRGAAHEAHRHSHSPLDRKTQHAVGHNHAPHRPWMLGH